MISLSTKPNQNDSSCQFMEKINKIQYTYDILKALGKGDIVRARRDGDLLRDQEGRSCQHEHELSAAARWRGPAASSSGAHP